MRSIFFTYKRANKVAVTCFYQLRRLRQIRRRVERDVTLYTAGDGSCHLPA